MGEEATPRLSKGRRLGKYRLESLIDIGAYARVFRARDTIEGRRVALKIISPDLVESMGREEVEREARIASRLRHPNIASIENADWIQGRLVFAQPLAKTSLASFPTARRSPRVALGILKDVVSGLAHAHQHRIVHRDVKPENILIFEDGHAAICDFGISRLSTPRTLTITEAGTLGYVAPEQAYGRPAFTSDVFSLGMVIYEILTGVLPKWPFERPPEGFERLERRIDPSMIQVLIKAIEFEPKKRFRDAISFQESVERALRSARSETRSKPRKKRITKSARELTTAYFRRTYGKALKLSYDCHSCGGPISEAMQNCSWCGTSDNSFWEVSASSWVCPSCEKGVRPEWTACPWCTHVRLEGNGRKPPQDPLAERRCSRRGCDGQLRPFMRFCPRCKQKVKKPWVIEALTDRCPDCRSSVSLDFWQFCPWCSKKFSHRAHS